jgi:RNA polymerase sigma-70 factor
MEASAVCPTCKQAWGTEGYCLQCGNAGSASDPRPSGQEDALPSEVKSRIAREWHLARQTYSRVSLSCDAFEIKVIAVVQERFRSRNETELSEAISADIRQFLETLRWQELFLTTACAAGDGDAWELFRSQYQSMIRATALRATSRPDDAKDLSDTFMTDLFLPASRTGPRTESKISQYHGMGSLEGWIKVVIHRFAIDRFRARRKGTSLEDLDTEPISNNSSSRAEHRVEESDRQQAIDMMSDALSMALRQLKPKERLALNLYYVQGLNLKEIARWLNAHESTASRLLDRLREQLRKAVSKHLQVKFKVRKSEILHLIQLAETDLNIDLKEVLRE